LAKFAAGSGDVRNIERSIRQSARTHTDEGKIGDLAPVEIFLHAEPAIGVSGREQLRKARLTEGSDAAPHGIADATAFLDTDDGVTFAQEPGGCHGAHMAEADNNYNAHGSAPAGQALEQQWAKH
jgi:hypothetical protein